MQNAQLFFLIETVEMYLEDSEVQKAIDALRELDKKTGAGINQDVILASGNFKEAEKQSQRGLISPQDYAMAKARTRYALSQLLLEVPRRIELNNRDSRGKAFKIEIPDTKILEAKLGIDSHLLKIGWVEKARKAANAVCCVVLPGGKTGTGFLTKDGYIFTNNHVLESAAEAKTASIEFNYEEGQSAMVYQLDVSDFKTSPRTELDYARVKVIDRPDAALSQWGYLDFETERIPKVGEPVTIIQHPNGEEKQIALTDNNVRSQMDQYLFYSTDTRPGSSGSPVFNNDWKVVAIHHAGKNNDDGGLVINEQGERDGTNRGVLFREILADIKK